MVLLCVKAPSVPPVVSMSVSVKLLLASLSVKVMVAVWPLPSVVLSLVMAMPGGVASVAYWKTTWLLLSCTVPAMPER